MVTLISSEAIAAVKHSLSSKVFYRNHKEKEYQYKAIGVGVEYYLYNVKGINIKSARLINIKNSKMLIESEHALFFRFPIDRYKSFYPLTSIRSCFHSSQDSGDENKFINKGSAYIGTGYEIQVVNNVLVKVEGSLFKDFYNFISIHNGDDVSRKFYCSPIGGKTRVLVSINKIDNIFVELDGYYARTFKKCSREYGNTLSFRFSF